MKKVQPFTIGTKLSVPNGTKCQDFVDIILPVPALDGCKSNLNDGTSCNHDQTHPTNHDKTPVQDCSEQERDSLHPLASSRSIRKIAICGSSETSGDCGLVDPQTSTYEPTSQHSSSDKSLLHPESGPWRKRKMKSLQYDFGIPAFPLVHPEDASHSQERDIKDFENSLIQLTTSLDLKKDDPDATALKKSSAAELGLEVLGRRSSIGEHIDKLRLKFRSLLQDYQQDLMLALDVSSFYQQADNIISIINSKMSSPPVTNVQTDVKEKEIRETADQITMLNESAARLSNLHPTLASRVTRKQAEVKESWERLQDALRNHRVDPPSTPLILPKEHSDPQTASTESQHLSEPELQGVMGKDVKEEQNRLRGSECCQDPWIYRMLSPVEDRSRAELSEDSCCKPDITPEKQNMDSDSKDQSAPTQNFSQHNPPKLSECLVQSTTSADQTWSWLKDSRSSPSGEVGSNSKSTKIEELLDQVEVLWEGLRKRFGQGAEVDPAEKELLLMDDVAAQACLEHHLPLENMEEHRSGMLTKFLQFLDHKETLQNGSAVSELTEALTDAAADVNMRGCSHNHDHSEELLAMQLSTLTLRINQHLSRCAELSMDILDMETDMAMLCDPEVPGLDGIREQQDDLEIDYRLIEGEVEDMEILLREAPPTDQGDFLAEEVQSVLQAWEEAGHSMVENRERLAKFNQLRTFFENHLATVAWTERTRSYILTGSAALQSEDLIDCEIEHKLQEFDKLAAAGHRLTEEGDYLAEIIKERTDELKSMLEWIQVNWKTLREQLSQKKVSESLDKEVNHPQNQALTAVDCQQNAADPALVIQESGPQTSLGSSICLILSFDEQSSGIGQLSSSSDDVHMQQFLGHNNRQWQQSSVHNSQSPGSQEQSVQREETHMDPNSAQNPQFWSKVQHPHGNQLTKKQHSSAHMQPSLDMLTRQAEVINQVQTLANAQKQRQQSPVNDVEQRLQSPRIIQVQQLQLPVLYQTAANYTEQQEEQKEKAETLVRTCHHHQQPSSNTQQQSTNSYLSEKQQLISSDPINHSGSEGHSPQVSLQSADRSQVKDQQAVSINQPSPNISPTQIPLEREEAAEVTHRVSTYLHVTDSLKASRASEMKGTLSSGFTVLCEEQMKRKESSQRRCSALGTVPQSNSSPCSYRQRSNTWPKGGQGCQKQHTNTEQGLSIQKCLADAVRTEEPVDVLRENSSEVPREPVKHICSYLSLGSTLSFSLPRVLYSDTADLRSSEEMVQSSVTSPAGSLAEMPHSAVEVQPITAHDSQGKSNRQTVYRLDLAKQDLNHENKHQQLQQRVHAPGTMTPTKQFCQTKTDMEQHTSDEQCSESEEPVTVAGHTSYSPTCSPASSCRHKCLSVHTMIKDLNGHIYHASRCSQWSCQTNSVFLQNEDSPNQLTESTLVSKKSNRIVLCGERGCTVCGSARAEESSAAPNAEERVKVPQPSHWQFQEEEEELEDIWKGRVDAMKLAGL